MQQGQSVEAAHIYSQALEHWPNDPQLMLALARANRQAGNYPQAIAAYRQATLAHDLRGSLARMGGDLSRAAA